MPHKKKLLCLMAALMLSITLAFTMAGCGSGDEELVLYPISDESAATTSQDNPEASGAGETDKIIEVTNSYLNAGKAPTISVEDVYNNIVIGKDSGYQILSVRKPEHYALGHIPGAINIQYGHIYQTQNLEKLDKNKKIVVVCYTGHTASQVAMFLNQLGYQAYAMKFGMMGWTSDSTVLALNPFTKAADYPIETQVNKAEPSNDIPLVNTGKEDASAIIKSQTETYLSSGKAPTISVEDVYTNAVLDKDPTYLILSIRKPEHYAKGHIPGAINIPYAQIAKTDSLKKLPGNKKIVVVCYTGHTASYTTMFLNQLGYDAYAMKFGMMGWTSDSAVLALNPFTQSAGHPTAAGTKP